MGFETSDDAAVYKLSDDLAMINTVDFITPPVDDPYWFGQISAANSISDVYAMGGRPLTALNLVMFPGKHLDMGLLKDILRGGHDKVAEAGASMVGGHSVDDEEPKYGLCVNGVVRPDRIITNAGAKPGDTLILTKPLGSGVLFNAVRSGKFPYTDLARDILPVIAALNGPFIDVIEGYELHAGTDVTGFGIAGHSWEMAVGAGVRIIIDYARLPFFQGALEMYKKGENTGSNKPNRQLVENHLNITLPLSGAEQELLYDPQTSGGLLLSVPYNQKNEILTRLKNHGMPWAVEIGRVEDGPASVTIC